MNDFHQLSLVLTTGNVVLDMGDAGQGSWIEQGKVARLLGREGKGASDLQLRCGTEEEATQGEA